MTFLLLGKARLRPSPVANRLAETRPPGIVRSPLGRRLSITEVEVAITRRRRGVGCEMGTGAYSLNITRLPVGRSTQVSRGVTIRQGCLGANRPRLAKASSRVTIGVSTKFGDHMEHVRQQGCRHTSFLRDLSGEWPRRRRRSKGLRARGAKASRSGTDLRQSRARSNSAIRRRSRATIITDMRPTST